MKCVSFNVLINFSNNKNIGQQGVKDARISNIAC